MITKTDQHLHFETQLKWKEGSVGQTSAKGIDTTIEVATPPGFGGGSPGIWSPEHLFLSSLSSCLMATFLTLAEKKRLTISHFMCRVVGRIQMIDEHLEFTAIDLYPEVNVYTAEDIQKASEVLLKSYNQCIIANSISSILVNHQEILLNAAGAKAN